MLPCSSVEVDTHLEAGKQAVCQNQYEEATVHFTNAIRADPGSANLRIRRAALFATRRLWAQAQGDCMLAFRALCYCRQDESPEVILGLLGECSLHTADHIAHVLAMENLRRLGFVEAATRLVLRGLQVPALQQTIRDVRAHGETTVGYDRAYDFRLLATKQAREEADAQFLAYVLATSSEHRAQPGGARDPATALAMMQKLVTAGAVQGGLEVRHGAKGYGIFATRPFDQGATVLVERPFATVAADPNAQCDRCLRRFGAPAVSCEAGCNVLFCSTECKRAALNDYHGPFCGMDMSLIASQFAKGKTTSAGVGAMAVKLVGKALAHAYKRGATSLQSSPADALPTALLWRASDSGQQKLPLAVLKVYMEFHRALAAACEKGHLRALRILMDPFLDVDAFAALDSVIQVNALSAGGYREVGMSLLIPGSLFNHDCGANLGYVPDSAQGAVGRFVAMKPVRAGEELCICYTLSTDAVEKRLPALFFTYGFVCECETCKRQAGPKYKDSVDVLRSEALLVRPATM